MTTRYQIRLNYKLQTGTLPNGSYLSLSNNVINANLDTELTTYIKWLEDQLMIKQDQFDKLITKKQK